MDDADADEMKNNNKQLLRAFPLAAAEQLSAESLQHGEAFSSLAESLLQ